MKATLHFEKIEQPVAELDEVKLVRLNDNHQAAPVKIFFKTRQLNSGKTFVELHRDRKLTVKLEDGRTGSVLLLHQNADAQGNAVGVLRVLGEI